MTIEEIKETLYSYYDIDEEYGEDERGCYLSGKWFSIKEIIEILERAL